VEKKCPGIERGSDPTQPNDKSARKILGGWVHQDKKEKSLLLSLPR